MLMVWAVINKVNGVVETIEINLNKACNIAQTKALELGQKDYNTLYSIKQEPAPNKRQELRDAMGNIIAITTKGKIYLIEEAKALTVKYHNSDQFTWNTYYTIREF